MFDSFMGLEVAQFIYVKVLVDHSYRYTDEVLEAWWILPCCRVFRHILISRSRYEEWRK